MMMALGISPDYAGWWMTIHPGPLGLDESDSDDGGKVASQPSEEDDQMDVDNPIHNRPPLAGGLDVLAAITPILGNSLY